MEICVRIAKMWILCISVFGLILHVTSGYRCICARSDSSIHMYANSSSPKIGQFGKGDCVSFDRVKEWGQWIKIAEENYFGYVPKDGMSIQTCQEHTENSSNRLKRFLIQEIPCTNKALCTTCICEHFGDLNYANDHKGCFSCWGCIGKVHCENRHENHIHHSTKSGTPKPIVTTTSKPIPTTTVKSADEHTCDKLGVLQTLAEETYLRNRTCTRSSDADSHNFLIDQCDAVPHRIQWVQKRKIIDNCDKILPYTAVGSKTYGIYGSFVDCNVNENGVQEIKIATQFCNKPAEVIHIPDRTNQHGYGIPSSYYTIAW